MEADELNALRCGSCWKRKEIGGQLICIMTEYPITSESPACISHTKVLETLYGNNNN